MGGGAFFWFGGGVKGSVFAVAAAVVVVVVVVICAIPQCRSVVASQTVRSLRRNILQKNDIYIVVNVVIEHLAITSAESFLVQVLTVNYCWLGFISSRPSVSATAPNASS